MTSFLFLFLLLQEAQQSQPKPVVEESIVVSGIRADDEKPVTKTNLTREDIVRDYHNQDIPLLLRDTPSINAYTEAGVGGSGYSYITLRGVSPTRLNFTLDGVPLADSEDMATYFADFPDLARSLQSIQIQRGVGTSTVGSPSFGGSINLESIALSQKSETEVDVAGGSYGQKFGSVGWQSGITPGGYAMYTRISDLENDGYREHSGVHQRDLFFSGMKQNDNSQLRLTGFSAHERQHMSFLATDTDTLRVDRRANLLGPDDNDSFGYDLANLQYLRNLSPSTNVTAQAYYQRGYGWYSLNGGRYSLDGRLLGTLLTMSWTRGPFTANYGFGANTFKRVHAFTLPTDFISDYSNYGVKSEENAFAKVSYDAARWHYYGDAQLRTADFHYHGDVAAVEGDLKIAPIRWTFFNPKIGARYDLTASSSLYGSAGTSTREPARNDLFQGEDNADIVHDLHAVRPERLYDFEAGWNFTAPRTSVAANAYAMEFRHEIAATGQLSDIGLPLRVNVDRSYRRGFELDARFDVTPRVRLRTNANVSRNRIKTWVQSYDVYDDAGNYVESRLLTHTNVNPLLTPRAIVNQSVDYAATSRLSVGGTARYVAKSYLDNTNNDAFVAPSFFVVDAKAAFALPRNSRVTLQVNNVTNRKTYYPSGYSYLTMNPAGVIGGTSYFYPQATRNFVIMLDARP
jgi:iron complex outermembrane recepter protein